MLREKIRFINPEWFREPPSELELTLRIPYLLKHSFFLFLKRPGPKWLVVSIILWLVFKSVLFSVFTGFFIALASELFTLRKYFQTHAVPKHLKNFKRIKKSFKGIKNATSEELVTNIEKSVWLSSWGLINIGYVGLSALGWEIIFKVLYPLLTSSDIPYQNLLVGFGNMAADSDQALWETAQEEDKEKQKIKLEKYLLKYGSKVDDLEISKPTLREQPKVINKLLELYSKTNSPYSVLEKQKKNRIENTKTVMNNLRVPKQSFTSLLKIVQENVSLREDRRHYHFIADYYIRKMILQLEKQLEIENGHIFELSWKEIKSKI